jgi:5'-3' exonuclease
MEKKQHQSLNEAIKQVVLGETVETIDEDMMPYDYSQFSRDIFALSVSLNKIMASDEYKLLPTKQMKKIKTIRKDILGLVKEIDKL